MSTNSPASRPSFISTQVRGGRYLFLDLKPRPGPELRVVCAGREECASDYRIRRRSFRYHAVEYVISGSWRFQTGGQVVELGPGSLFAYGPGMDYSLEASGESGLVKYFVDFTGRRGEELVESCGLGGGRVLRIQQTRWLHDLFDQMLDCALLGREPARRIASRLAELLLLRIPEDLRGGTHPQAEAQRTYARCRQHIQEHYLRIMSVAEIADRCNLDAAYLSRLFRRHADETPLQFLTRLKMDQAAELILRNGFAVKQAGAAVGYDDPYHFSRVFRRVHGVSPGRFSRG